MKVAKAIQRLTEAFERLPGIGPKTAQRLTFYLLHVPQSVLDDFSNALTNLKKETKICSICFNVSETDPCSVCVDRERDQSVICVVEQPLDVLAMEKGNFFHGLYHVLHGVINPLENIGPDQLHIHDLLPRLKNSHINEIIIATNPTVEGEATAMYVARLLRQFKNENSQFKDLKITRIGRGLPTGADLQYADETTLSRSFEGRRDY